MRFGSLLTRAVHGRRLGYLARQGGAACIVACNAAAQSTSAVGFDVTSVTLEITPHLSARRLNVRATLTIDNPSLGTAFDFLLADWYDRVTVTSHSGPATVARTGDGTVHIAVSKASAKEELVFELTGAPKSMSEKRAVLSDSSVFLLWSDRFYPAVFDDWALFRATIALPVGFRVMSPGTVREGPATDASMRTWLLETSQPIRVASIIADRRWIERTVVQDGIRIRTLLDPASERFADSIVSTSGEVLATYQHLFGPYRFDAFTFATVDGIHARRAVAGGVVYEPSYLRQEMDSTGHDAHETALLWWGFTAAGAGPGSYQWTEGFGDYAEFLYDEMHGRPIPEDFLLYRRGYLRTAGTSDEPSFTDPRASPVWGNYVHGRLPFLMHFMRFAVGDSAFLRGVRLLFDRYHFRTYTIDEFVATMSEAAGQPLDWWKAEWIDRKGVPNLTWTATTRRAAGRYSLTISIDQSGPLYHLPLEIRIRTPTGEGLHRVTISAAHNSYTFATDTLQPDVSIDSHAWLLARITRR